MLGEEQRQQYHGAELARGGSADDQLADRTVDGVGVLQDRHQQPQRGHHECHADEQRVLDDPGDSERPTHQYGKHDRARRPGRDTSRERPLPSPGVDLEPGEEQQEAQADDGQSLNSLVGPHQIQHRRPQNDTGHYLEDRTRKVSPWHQGQKEGNARGHCQNDDQIVVVHRDSQGPAPG